MEDKLFYDKLEMKKQLELTPPFRATEDSVSIVRGLDKQWRWRRVAANGAIVGASTEGYINFNDCRDNYLRSLLKPIRDFEVEIEE